MNLFDEIKKLNFPNDKYVVVGGAAMAARGIKETGDIDIVVMPDLFDRCKLEGWGGIAQDPIVSLGCEKESWKFILM
jgi:hypothetical protein